MRYAFDDNTIREFPGGTWEGSPGAFDRYGLCLLIAGRRVPTPLMGESRRCDFWPLPQASSGALEM